MFPSAEFLGVGLYNWMFLIGVLAAMGTARLFSGRAGISAKVFNIILLSAVCGVGVGYACALLLESFWEYLETGVFVWGTGATFYGGLIGAAGTYLGVYFLAGKVFCGKGEHIAEFHKMLSLVFPCIALAHGIGRLGCLFQGCCYGAETDGPFGVRMFVNGEWQTRVPVQLFEAIFLVLLAVLMLVLFLRFGFEYNVGLYLIAYGVWRFCIEFARADDRGASGVGTLSPSQLLSVVLVIAGVAAILIYRFRPKKRRGERA